MRKYIPTKEEHINRNRHNIVPSFPLLLKEIDGEKCFYDKKSGVKWKVLPWWKTMFHKPWKNVKLLAYGEACNIDKLDIVLQDDIENCASELIVKRKAVKHGMICGSNVVDASFNYRKGERGGGGWLCCGAHWKADVWPNLVYKQKHKEYKVRVEEKEKQYPSPYSETVVRLDDVEMDC